MKMTINERLLRRSIGDNQHGWTNVKELYGDRTWVDDLDIINELGGHTGCVNALSWSRSGRFLASGSDDTYLNIWSYNPDSLAKPFSLHTSVATGHAANIFAVKFAPHSNDRTVITCAGDAQVRVFDTEYGGIYDNSSGAARVFDDSTRSRRFQNFFNNARFLNVGNTNARVYRSHSDRVKRIVTESSPYTFLTCSEDGEVRQWDLRQPSSFYPAPRGGQGFRSRIQGNDHDADNVPPPLISYKKYSIGLNSISCAASQPYYLLLGGVHSHCFLHDRRMTGRNLVRERGQVSRSLPDVGSHDDDSMDQATRCVKRFAPNNKLVMDKRGNGHITACKISDANPNEVIASWSGDHIYSFDIVQSPDVRDAAIQKERTLRQNYAAARQQRDRKRKRAKGTSSSNLNEPAKTRMRSGHGTQNEGEVSVRVRYGNGQSETIPIGPSEGEVTAAGSSSGTTLSEAQRLSQRIARSLVQLRKSVFDLDASIQDAAILESSERTPFTATFTSVLGQAAALLPQIDEVIRDWSYPIDPSPEDVTLQNTLRRNRQASRRLVQASGCLAAALGGRLQTVSPVADPRMALFERIEPAPREGAGIGDNERFCYDFLKAILLWLSAGHDAVLRAFRKQPDQFRDSRRFPLEPDDGLDAFDGKLLPYLLDLAQDDKPIYNIDANRFETEESRTIFESQVAAVNAFAGAFRQSSRNTEVSGQTPGSPSPHQTLDLGAACRFWGVRVGRSLLMEAGEGVNYGFVRRAFGGLWVPIAEDVTSNQQEEIDAADESVNAISVVGASDTEMDATVEEVTDSARHAPSASESPKRITGETANSTNGDTIMTDSDEAVGSRNDAGQAGDETDDDYHEEEEEEEEDDDDDAAASIASDREHSDDDADGPGRTLFSRPIGFGESKERAKVEFDKPYSSHTRVYKGHCNLRTVKDVNFYGLNDEYVVSGSDSGHIFIWDRKTTQLVNILDGDGEIVNVVTGHPYEPMIAASGIDSTIKIFSPDERLQEEARHGINIARPSDATSTHSSLRYGLPRRRQAQPIDPLPDGSPTGLTSKKRMAQCYEITSKNDIDRRDRIGEPDIARAMLARFAARLHQGTGPGEVVIIDDQCSVM